MLFLFISKHVVTPKFIFDFYKPEKGVIGCRTTEKKQFGGSGEGNKRDDNLIIGDKWFG